MNKKPLRLITIILGLYLIVTTIGSIADLWRAGDKLTERESRVANLERQKEQLETKKAAVNNPYYWEKVARDQLGLSKPGEEIVVIPKELLVDNSKVPSEPAVPNWQKWVRLVL